MKPVRVFLGFLLIFFSCNSLNDNKVSTTPLADFNAPFYFGLFQPSPGNSLTVEGVELGRMLFYDKRLSKDSTISCASCHQQARAFTDGKKFGIGIRGQVVERSTMSLVNMLWSTPHKFWDGRAQTLEIQALQPIENSKEMDLSIKEALRRLNKIPEYKSKFKNAFGGRKIKKEHLAKALAQFERTLISQNSKYDRFLRGEEKLSKIELKGMQSFFTHPDASIGLRGSNCGDCHRNFLTDGFNDSFDGFANNGLDNEANLENGLFDVTGNPLDKGKFKIPSLRNIALTAPYMHDGRFNTLEEVLDHYNEHIKESNTLDILIREASNELKQAGDPIALKLSEDDKKDIISFLLTLTDSTFITNENFSNPFAN